MDDALEFAVETCHRAGRLLREIYNRPHTVRHKRYFMDIVTEADVAVEQLIVEATRSRFPEHKILSEEGLGDAVSLAPERVQAEGIQPLWLADPLDGTVNYAHGYDVWSVSMALTVAGRVQVGVTYDPLRDETFWAERGQGAWCNGSRLLVSEVSCLEQALLATGFPHIRVSERDTNLAEFNAIAPLVHGVRRAGSAALDLANVAAGRLDGYWEMHCSPWDWAVGWLLVEEAGGLVTDMDGAAFSLDKDRIVASGGRIQEELLAVLKRARQT